MSVKMRGEAAKGVTDFSSGDAHGLELAFVVGARFGAVVGHENNLFA